MLLRVDLYDAPDMRGTLRLAGEHIDEQADPVAGATVTIEDGRHALSEHGGSFGFDGLASGVLRLAARKADLCTGIVLVTVRSARDLVRLTLSRGMTLLVRVLDGDAPLRGAQVTHGQAARIEVSTITDERGRGHCRPRGTVSQPRRHRERVRASLRLRVAGPRPRCNDRAHGPPGSRCSDEWEGTGCR